MLGVTDHILQGADIKLKFRNTDELIVSPSRGRSRRYRRYVISHLPEHIIEFFFFFKVIKVQ